jgi:membrane dipeptidase
MVNFSPAFISEQVRLWAEPLWKEWKRLENLYPTDTKRVTKELRAWTAQHPGPKATLAQVADHIDHIRDVAGIDHVGLGSTSTGSRTPVGLEDVSAPDPARRAERRGYSADDVKKVAGATSSGDARG